MIKADNLFDNIPADIPEELFTDLVVGKGFRVERIVSKGQASPEGFWYDQERDEWILVLKGRARLTFAEGPRTYHLGPGDYLNIPARARHRVDWTDPDTETLWLAVHTL